MRILTVLAQIQRHTATTEETVVMRWSAAQGPRVKSLGSLIQRLASNDP